MEGAVSESTVHKHNGRHSGSQSISQLGYPVPEIPQLETYSFGLTQIMRYHKQFI
jgi:hypothetical protein